MMRVFTASLALALLGAIHAQPAAGPAEAAASERSEMQSFATWSYESRDGGGLWAGASSDLGTLGEYCNGEVGFCAWMLVLRGAQCIKGDDHPILLNTDQVAAAHTIRCVGSVAGRGATFAFTDFDAINEAVRASQQLAIAFPGEGDTIVVTHFPLAGATAALDRLHKAFTEQSPTHEGYDEHSRERISPRAMSPDRVTL